MIDVSMLESMLSLTLSEIQAAQFAVAPPGRPIFGPVATKDGYINLSIASERTFQNLAIASGHPQWITDPRFAEYPDRRANWGELIDELESWSKERTTAEVQAVFDRHGVPSSPYRTVKEAMADPQIAHRRALRRGARCGRHVSGAQPAVPDVRRDGRSPAICRRARRAHRGAAGRDRLHAGRDRGAGQDPRRPARSRVTTTSRRAAVRRTD